MRRLFGAVALFGVSSACKGGLYDTMFVPDGSEETAPCAARYCTVEEHQFELCRRGCLDGDETYSCEGLDKLGIFKDPKNIPTTISCDFLKCNAYCAKSLYDGDLWNHANHMNQCLAIQTKVNAALFQGEAACDVDCSGATSSGLAGVFVIIAAYLMN